MGEINDADGVLDRVHHGPVMERDTPGPGQPAEPRPCARILVAGTLAIDTVCDYPGDFAALPRQPGLNLSVQLNGMARRFGGCAMNIAYTLKALGCEPAPFVFVGRDFDADYAAHLQRLGMDTSGVNVADAPYSSHCFIFTDRHQNQFTGFFGGPATVPDFAPRLKRFATAGGFASAILAPDLPANMIAAAKVLRELGIPFLADPGQNITDFRAADAMALARLSKTLIVNEFEHATLRRLAGDDALAHLDPLIVTLGKRGARWRSKREGDGEQGAVAADVVDPTGCGDAFRAGLTFARLRGASLADAVRAGGVTASIALASAGAQEHRCDDFAERYRAAWDDSPCWLDAAPSENHP